MDEDILTAFFLSLRVATISTLFVAITGTALAYILARKNFFGKNLIDSLLTLPMVMPPTIVGFYLIILLGKNGIIGSYIYRWTGLNLMFTWQAAVIAAYVVSLPLMVKTVRTAIESIDENIIKTSYSLGHSEGETFFKIIFPLIRKGFLTGFIISFVRALGEFGATLIFAGNIPGKTETMPIMIYSLVVSGEWDRANLIVAFYSLFSIIAVLLSLKLSERSVRPC